MEINRRATFNVYVRNITLSKLPSLYCKSMKKWLYKVARAQNFLTTPIANGSSTIIYA